MLNGIQSNNNVNFYGYKTKFSKDLEHFMSKKRPSESDSFELKNEMSEIIQSRVNDKYFMGEGKSNKVYRIDDYYIMRFNKYSNPYISKPVKEPASEDKGLKTYFGNILVRFGNVKIIKNATAGKNDTIVAGIPVSILKSKNMALKNELIKRSVSEFVKLPQSAYDKVASDFNTLNKNSQGYHRKFDCYNPNNFIKVGKQIRIVDDIEDGLGAHDAADMLNIFIREYDTKVTDKETINQRKQMFSKCIIASVKNDLEIVPFKIEKYVAKLGLKTDAKTFVANVEDINKQPDKTKYKSLKEYLNNL